MCDGAHPRGPRQRSREVLEYTAAVQDGRRSCTRDSAAGPSLVGFPARGCEQLSRRALSTACPPDRAAAGVVCSAGTPFLGQRRGPTLVTGWRPGVKPRTPQLSRGPAVPCRPTPKQFPGPVRGGSGRSLPTALISVGERGPVRAAAGRRRTATLSGSRRPTTTLLRVPRALKAVGERARPWDTGVIRRTAPGPGMGGDYAGDRSRPARPSPPHTPTQVDSRTTSRQGTLCRPGAGSASMASSSRRAARRPISERSVSMVVRGGREARAMTSQLS